MGRGTGPIRARTAPAYTRRVRCALLLAGFLATTLAACGREPVPARTETPAPPAARVVDPPRRAPEKSPETPASEAPAVLPPEQRPYVATRTLAGRVVDPKGRPVEGARVEFGGASALTGKDGAFRLDGLEAKNSTAQVTAPGFAIEQWVTWPGREDLVVTIRRIVRASGIVVQPDGTPAEGALVVHAGTTGADGRFEVDLLEGSDGIYAEWGTLPGCRVDDQAASGVVFLDVDPEHPDEDVRVVLDTRWSWIGARAVREDGSVVPAANVAVHVPGKARWWLANHDGTGSWSVPVPPGTEVALRAEVSERGVVTAKGVVRASTLPGAGAQADVVVRPVEIAKIDKPSEETTPERGSIEVTGSDARALERGALHLWIVGPGLDSLTNDRLSVARPSYVTGSVRPGRYVAELFPDARTAGAERWWIRHFDVKADTRERVVCDGIDPPRALRGRVVGPDGEPLAAVAMDVYGSSRFRSPDQGQTATDAAGRFEVMLPDADHCWVTAHRDGFAWGFVRVDPRTASETEIRLARGGTIEFHVADGDNVASRATIESPSGELRLSAEVEWVDGFQSIRNAPAGRWTLHEAGSQKPRTVTVDVRDGEKTAVKLDAE